MIQKYKQFIVREGKAEQEKIDELLDKGVDNLNPQEKELLDRLSKGGMLEQEGDQPGKNVVHQDDDDLDYLNKMIGANIDYTEVKPVEFESPKLPAGDVPFVEGDRIVYYKDGSEHDGKTGIFVGIREDDGKYRIVFNDKKKLVANAKNVYKDGTERPKKKVPEGYREIPEERLGRAEWGPGTFEMPETFFGSKGAPEGKVPKKVGYKKGDKVMYKNPKSEHDGKAATFVEQKEDGKLSIRFEGGGKLACNPKNVVAYSIELPREDFILRLGNIPEDNSIGAGVFLDNGDMYDEHILNQYPELQRMGFEEPTEGDLRYNGDLSLEELYIELQERGFRAEVVQGNLY
jgi:hypothetical protein